MSDYDKPPKLKTNRVNLILSIFGLVLMLVGVCLLPASQHDIGLWFTLSFIGVIIVIVGYWREAGRQAIHSSKEKKALFEHLNEKHMRVDDGNLSQLRYLHKTLSREGK